MAFAAKMIADSVNPYGQRITSLALTYPRFIHSEFMTHRDRARNSASSRAIPWPKMAKQIQDEPVIPIRFGSEQKGMQTGGEVDDVTAATAIWLKARDAALAAAHEMAALGVHKSIVNRITEPYMWITVVTTATDWRNLFRLRKHGDAEIHFQELMGHVEPAMAESTPKQLEVGEWHLPFVSGAEMKEIEAWQQALPRGLSDSDNFEPNPRRWDKHLAQKISTARCARVSYLTHDGKRDFEADLTLFDRLVQGSGFGHMSPHEHVAMAVTRDVRSGPFRGFVQYRKFFSNENADDQPAGVL